MQNERRVLVSALLKAEKSGYSNLILDSILKESDLSDVKKGFVTSAFYGVLERKISIDYILDKFLLRPIRKAPPFTAAVLRSAVYQIVFMDKIPDSAAVNESVKIIKKSKEHGNSGLVNAVLRKISDYDCRSLVDNCDMPSVKYSVNNWIWKRLSSDYSVQMAESFLINALTPPPVFIRINNLKGNAYLKVENEFLAKGGRLEKTKLEHCYIAYGIKALEAMQSYKNGFFFVQDFSSQLCVKALDAKAGDRVLDCCAAPGGKTFSIALDMENKGEIISTDLHEHRVGLIKKGADRLGLSCVKPLVCDASIYNEDFGSFDKVLCDAPCSGIGVIRRKPEIKYKKLEECNELPSIQMSILENAARYVKTGGKLVYSTCTLLKNENEEVVKGFLNKNNSFNLISVFDNSMTKTCIPPQDLGDGFFIAVMERL